MNWALDLLAAVPSPAPVPTHSSPSSGVSIVQLMTAGGVGAILLAIVNWLLRDRKKQALDAEKTDVDTKLAYLNTVIERLDAEAKRSLAERDRLQGELTAEQERNAILRKRVRDLEDEIDGVRKSARETQHKCDELAHRLKELVEISQEEDPK